jgi:hypothetical protein
MDQSFPASDAVLVANAPPPAASSANTLVRLASIVRDLTADLLCARDTRIVKIATEHSGENAGGCSVEVEVFAPNPELTVSLRGVKAILERHYYRLHFNVGMQLVALEPVEE